MRGSPHVDLASWWTNPPVIPRRFHECMNLLNPQWLFFLSTVSNALVFFRHFLVVIFNKAQGCWWPGWETPRSFISFWVICKCFKHYIILLIRFLFLLITICRPVNMSFDIKIVKEICCIAPFYCCYQRKR